ncbi:polyprenyl synthetase family protein [Streptomyces millisiae]|uniref:Polyprenyl synthetase family protein n=1 Tax=Streptomyces millisiae TaxID=3075542 RepID=A0ABU2LJ21_9ACTN|nr:polyprenyl synthetase family protein [Streptomyces sp. DSM 44918]MDT0317588.1 polyprenyl synthetase family protein [Streptomyces sp. DSM 44918]
MTTSGSLPHDPVHAVPPPTRRLTQAALREAVGHLDASLERMFGYHMGWWGERGDPCPEAAEGKALRPTLAFLGADAADVPTATAEPGAVAVELIHNSTLIHDDMMDGDTVRRNRPAVWQVFGTGPAILLGDGLHACAVATLLRRGGRHGPDAVRLLSGMLMRLVRGQARDLALARRPWQGPETVAITEYRAMAADKTASLLGCATAIGAQLGGASPTTLRTLVQAGEHLGLAFQFVDDLLGVWGPPRATGKQTSTDLARGQKTLPLLTAVGSGTDDGARLAAMLERGLADPDAMAHAAELAERAGARAATERAARHHLTLARRAFASLAPPPEARDAFDELATTVIGRAALAADAPGEPEGGAR